MLDLDSPINHEWGINVYVYISVNVLCKSAFINW